MLCGIDFFRGCGLQFHNANFWEFSMAEMIPQLSKDKLARLEKRAIHDGDILRSQAEVKVYGALSKLPQGYVVFSNIEYISSLSKRAPHKDDGEADFLVCHPDKGYLCIEVKGGSIGIDEGKKWFSADYLGVQHTIKNPPAQAKRAKRAIREILENDERWQALPCCGKTLLADAVFFPDMKEDDAKKLSVAYLPADLIGSTKTLQNPKAWIDEVFAHWQGGDESLVSIGPRGVDVIREVLTRSFFKPEPLSRMLDGWEQLRNDLTKQQMRILDSLQHKYRVAMSGGAGTGKTDLAIEKARRLAADGFRTLLTCCNEQLAGYLENKCAGTENLEVMSFRELCKRRAEAACLGKSYTDEQLPTALLDSMDILPDRYNAIVCDDGQDFSEDSWVSLELMLSEYKDSECLYIFYDDNKRLYERSVSIPIPKENTFPLIYNCRNTEPICRSAYKYYEGVSVSHSENKDGEVKFAPPSQGLDAQATKIHTQIREYIIEDGVSPDKITILIADADEKKMNDYCSALMTSEKLSLPKPAAWLRQGTRSKNTVLISTIENFMGLESDIVILWGLDDIDLDSTEYEKWLYIGMSRAKSVLIIVGNARTCDALEQRISRSPDDVAAAPETRPQRA
jgi:hypothetical protein